MCLIKKEQVDQHEKTVIQDLNVMREEIKKLKTKLTDSKDQNSPQPSTAETQDQQ